MPDLNTLAPLAKLGDAAAYDDLCRAGYHLVGACVKGRLRFLPPAWGDKADLVQEGMIGLMEAVRYWRPESGVTFVSFATLCIRCQIDQAVRMATRQKHRPLNYAESFDKPLPQAGGGGDREIYLLGALAADGATPEEAVISAEEMAAAQEVVEQLRSAVHSDLELAVFERCILRLESYKAVAADMARPWKSIDNASQRVMRQIRAKARELSEDDRYSPEMRAVLKRCGEPSRRRGGRPSVTDWIGDLAEEA